MQRFEYLIRLIIKQKRMKSKILLLIIFIGCLPLAGHSQKLTAEQFFAKQKVIFKEMNYDLAYKAKDYTKLAKIYSTIIGIYNNQVVEQEKPKLKGLMAGNIYYNAACIDFREGTFHTNWPPDLSNIAATCSMYIFPRSDELL